MRKKNVLPWVVVCVGCFLVATIPFFFTRSVTGSFLPRIILQLETDTNYYLSQVVEILDGHPFLGNPYLLEHANDTFPGLLLPLWIAAIPGVFGLSPNAIYAFGIFFYTILTGITFFLLCRKCFGKNEMLAAAIAVLGVASMHNLLIRPAVMQTIYPAAALFALAFLGVLESPLKGRRYIALGILSVLTFYLYPYLWMVAFAAVGIFTVWQIWQRNWQVVKYLVFMWIGIVIACLPQIFTIISLFSDELANQLNHRVEMVETHHVLPLTVFNLKYTYLTVLGLLLLQFKKKLSAPQILLLLLSSGVIIGSLSNVITGKEIDFHTHFWRMTLLVNVIGLAVFADTFLHAQMKFEKWIAGICLAAILFTTVSRVAIRVNAFEYFFRRETIVEYYKDVADVGRVLNVLNEKGTKDRVIMAPLTVSPFVLLYTEGYVFYQQRAAVHTVSNEELLERFLAYYVDYIDPQFLKDELDGYAGGGPLHEAIYINAYGGNVEPIDLIGGEEFIREALAQHQNIRSSYEDVLRKYNVNYIVTDSVSERNPRVPQGAKSIYTDDRFTVYELN